MQERHCIALVEQHSEVSMMLLTDKKRLSYNLVIQPRDLQVCKLNVCTTWGLQVQISLMCCMWFCFPK
jgi:hypothetical protein